MSQLLSRIDAALQTEQSPSKRGELLARRACYLARLGQFSESRGLIEQLRTAYASGSNPSVSIWIMLAEGLLRTFEELSTEGHDRVMRAQVLAVAIRDRTLVAWTSAWRAHLLSEHSDFGGMARALETAFGACADNEHEPIARASMVLANAYSTCGKRDHANGWYAAARHHALEVGDQATIDALIYNKAAFAMGWLRAEACFSPIDESDLAAIGDEITSARNYQNLIGIRAVSNFADLWRARLALLRGKYLDAIAGLNEARGKEPFAIYNFNQAMIDLELAYCHFRSGDLESATKLAAGLQADLSGLHRDEQLVAGWLCSQMDEVLPARKAEDLIGVSLDAAKSAYRSEQDELAAALQRFDGMAPPGLPDALLPHRLRPKY